jgi:transcriptional regulator with GAF, ATPase, and Fis domain
MESELFGHCKGSFTGAVNNREGKFSYADGGTIFLDEISDMPLDLQCKLLRFLENGEIQRVGEDNTIKVDVRIIAATNKNLEELIREGKFRDDLYHRLNRYKVSLPPLSERREDIPILIKHFIEQFNTRHNLNVNGISDEGMKKLLNHNFPGNIR